MADDNNAENDNIKQLREKADKATKLERENAMLRAGVDLDSKAGQYFAKGYEGELTAEAIKAEAEDFAGALKNTTPPPTDKKDDDVENGDENKGDPNETKDRLDLASNNGTPAANDGVNPYDGAFKAFDGAMKDGKTRENSAVDALDVIVKAAVAGDRRVRLD